MCPEGEVRIRVPSGSCFSPHPQNVFTKWWHRLAEEHFKGTLVSSINAANVHRLTRCSAYTSAMFSETRYALNGDLRIAYRATRERQLDLVFVSNWFTSCEVAPELPSIQGWVEAMTSLGRLIFFDQPGTGASDPVTPGALPTLEQWADSITAVLDALGSREAVLIAAPGALGTAALFAATHPSRTAALIVLECAADPGDRTELVGDELVSAIVAMWGTGEFQHLLNPDMPWNEEVRAALARQERLAASPRTVALMFPLVSELNVREILPTVRVPTLVVQHADDPFITPAMGKDVADHIPDAKYVELRGRNLYHFVEPWRDSFPGDRRVPHRASGRSAR